MNGVLVTNITSFLFFYLPQKNMLKIHIIIIIKIIINNHNNNNDHIYFVEDLINNFLKHINTNTEPKKKSKSCAMILKEKKKHNESIEPIHHQDDLPDVTHMHTHTHTWME